MREVTAWSCAVSDLRAPAMTHQLWQLCCYEKVHPCRAVLWRAPVNLIWEAFPAMCLMCPAFSEPGVLRRCSPNWVRRPL